MGEGGTEMRKTMIPKKGRVNRRISEGEEFYKRGKGAWKRRRGREKFRKNETGGEYEMRREKAIGKTKAQGCG